ncbi:MAG: precorrin-6y C5,15-methyltransferase (decarboxylating) subunit CbiE, partial [Desulfobulbaceae bacterium]|nr:precorrin-6y C5,15-methyltransferase (decarboxylating) subunit CbiE [Desulfobulbaceae bacterium]
MFRIELIGISPGAGLDARQREIVNRCGCVVASSRHRPLLDGCGLEIIPIAPVAQTLATVAERLGEQDVAVLASGDPLFFGIGRTLITKFGPERVVVHPALSSLQAACAKFGEPWDDIFILSLHGREAAGVAAKVMGHGKVFCFTDRVNSPDMVARALLAVCRSIDDEALASGYTVWVAENLGQDDERITCGTLTEIAAMAFADLNVMLLKKPERATASAIAFGLQEEEIDHSRGLITKSEVRAATLHHLRLPQRGVLWDVGAGSGSVGLEAARLCPGLQVFAVERNPEEL